MAQAQREDPQIRALQSSPTTSLVVEAIPLSDSSGTILCDTSTGSLRPLVPQSWQRVVFDSLHGLSYVLCLTLFMGSHTQASERPSVWSLVVLYGPASIVTCGDGHAPV